MDPIIFTTIILPLTVILLVAIIVVAVVSYVRARTASKARMYQAIEHENENQFSENNLDSELTHFPQNNVKDKQQGLADQNSTVGSFFEPFFARVRNLLSGTTSAESQNVETSKLGK